MYLSLPHCVCDSALIGRKVRNAKKKLSERHFCECYVINVFSAKMSIHISFKVWESQSGKELLSLTGHSDAVYCCAFSSNDAKIVSCSADHTVKVGTLY